MLYFMDECDLINLNNCKKKCLDMSDKSDLMVEK